MKTHPPRIFALACLTLTALTPLGAARAAASSPGNVQAQRANSAQRDNSAQRGIQAALDSRARSYARRDLSGLMATYAPEYAVYGITGGRLNFLQTQADYAQAFPHMDYQASYQFTVSSVAAHGTRAEAAMRYHYTYRHRKTAAGPAYTLVEEMAEQTTWRKSRGAWQQVSGQFLRTQQTYQRVGPNPPLPKGAVPSSPVRQQLQAVATRAAAGYGQRNPGAFLSMFAPSLQTRSVTGRVADLADVRADCKATFATRGFSTQARCTVGPVSVHGGQAFAAMEWHYTGHYAGGRTARPYDYRRDFSEQSAWTQTGGQWRQTRAQLTQDRIVYQRAPK